MLQSTTVHAQLQVALRYAPLEALFCFVQVLYAADSLAVVEGLNIDAPIGATVEFDSGATGCASHSACTCSE